MISICIPTYNTDCTGLLKSLNNQIKSLDTIIEIIVIDDGSTLHQVSNKAACSSMGFVHIENKENLGRVASRKKLAEMSKYPYLLFIDADMIPTSDKFIANYYTALNSKDNVDVFVGGIRYADKRNKFSLRLRYGKTREFRSSSDRNKYPYSAIFFGNILIDKKLFFSIFKTYNDESYGEDYFLASKLKLYQSKVLHIENNTLHLGIETNNVFLNKTEQAAYTLAKLFRNNKIDLAHNKLLLLYRFLSSYYLVGLAYYFLYVVVPVIKKSLIWFGGPLLFIDMYRLYYFLKSMKNEA